MGHHLRRCEDSAAPRRRFQFDPVVVGLFAAVVLGWGAVAVAYVVG